MSTPKVKPQSITFHLDVEFDNWDGEVMAAINELIEKAREYGKPTKATLIGLPPVMEIPV